MFKLAASSDSCGIWKITLDKKWCPIKLLRVFFTFGQDIYKYVEMCLYKYYLITMILFCLTLGIHSHHLVFKFFSEVLLFKQWPASCYVLCFVRMILAYQMYVNYFVLTMFATDFPVYLSTGKYCCPVCS